MPPARLAPLRSALLAWYDRHRRPLPWRRDRHPYRVWIAEIMLQQTRVAAVAPAYQRFLQRFPTVGALARATEDQVLSLWSGLGYYSRARNLHRAAQQIVSDHDSIFPADYAEALGLPGIGTYTAAAVLSIAYDQPHAVVDGNVRRVLARLRRLPPPDSRDEPYASTAQKLLAHDRAGDWNQALMELGETICLPRSPLCRACPLSKHCDAHRQGEVDRYPQARRRRARQRLQLELVIARDRNGRVLLERGAFPYLRHLWLPLQIGSDRPAAAQFVGDFRHAILHRDFDVKTYRQTMAAAQLRNLVGSRLPSGERRIFTRTEVDSIGRSSLLTKALRLCAQR